MSTESDATIRAACIQAAATALPLTSLFTGERGSDKAPVARAKAIVEFATVIYAEWMNNGPRPM